MNTQLVLEEITSHRLKPHVHSGPVLQDIVSSASTKLDDYVRAGGYEVLRHAIGLESDAIIRMIDDAGLRGRGGGGFPTAHKWDMVAHSGSRERYFICNINAAQPGGFKERYLTHTSPHRVVEAALLAAHAVGSSVALICLPYQMQVEAALLEEAFQAAYEQGLLRRNGSDAPLTAAIYRSTGSYITGEETALMELIQGRVPRPRGKPPMPTAKGLFGAPTVINNLETVLQAFFIVKHGAQKFRQIGTRYSPGSLIFSLSGHVKRAGLYELPLGTTLRELIFEYGQGITTDSKVKAILPGGVFSPAVNSSSLDARLDYDSAHESGFDLGSGVIIVISERTSAVDLARILADFFHEKSCGKCQPCKDGTRRTAAMLNALDRIDEKSIDIADRKIPPSPRTPALKVLNNSESSGAISYTDSVRGLDKITHLCEFYKHRGDCHHSVESANSIQRLIQLFPREFEDSMKGPNDIPKMELVNGH